MATVPILWDPIPVSVTLVGLEQTVVKVIFLNNHSQVENHKLYKKKTLIVVLMKRLKIHKHL